MSYFVSRNKPREKKMLISPRTAIEITFTQKQINDVIFGLNAFFELFIYFASVLIGLNYECIS